MFVLTNSEKEFVPTSQKDKENPLTFLVIPPTRKVVLDVQEKMLKCLGDDSELDVTKIPLADLMDSYLDVCVVGWKNVKDEKGNDVVFSKEVFKKFNDLEILTELYNFIRELSEADPLV